MTSLTQTTYHSPRVGILATVRNRCGIISTVEPFATAEGLLHLVRLEYIDADGLSEDALLWERELNATLLEPTTLPCAVREGLSEEHLAIFDLLCQEKPALTHPVRNRIKRVAAIKVRITQIDHWTAKEATRHQIATLIRDFLWDEHHRLPDPEYTTDEIPKLATAVYQHVYQQYRFPMETVYQQAA